MIRILGLTSALVLSACSSLSLNSDNVSVEYYNIDGNSTAALDEDIRAKGPKIDGGRHAVAVARIKMVPSVIFSTPRFESNQLRCDVENASVLVNAKVTLPRWTGRPKASAKLGRAWDSIDRYTRLHEATHVDIAFRFAKQMEEEIKSLPNTGSCDELKLAAKAVVDRSLLNHDLAQKEFDANEQRRFAKYSKSQSERKS